ncbi:MAG: N-acetylmuramoyl-L-alanine amidase [Rhizobiaceae bacterium]|nr:N-acetylmuramoyl-L-alanine amidase [Rhizobiaceae bacterium]
MRVADASMTGRSSPFGGLLRAALAAPVLAFALAAQAFAADAPGLTASGFKMAGDAVRTRVVLQFDKEPDLKWFLLRSPHRIVIDLPDTEFLVDPAELAARGLVDNVRFGSLGEGASRLILSSSGPFEVEKLDVLENDGGFGHRLVVDLAAASERKFEALLADQTETTGSTPAARKGDRLGHSADTREGRKFTIVIDPGHGGIDGGAESAGGTVEKSITLAFAFELRKKLLDLGEYAVVMTREKDEFLSLDERVVIARQHEADLFISIHADTIRLKGVRGATVYTVSDKASDAEAAETAHRENQSDKLAGIELGEENPQVADILVDLIRRETHSFSVQFARSLVGKLSTSVELINNPHRSAGFRVLRAPDVPSVLVELGYLSNAKDEEQLKSEEWRGKAADRIIDAIAAFAEAKGGQGG